MADLIRNLVEETANNPGTGLTVALLGAVTNRVSFVQLFGDGVQAAYVLTDGTQSEWGVGKVTAGSPNSLSRDTVLGNTAGTTARLNFTGAVRVYNELPAELVGEDKKAGAFAGNVGVTASSDLFSITLPPRARAITIVGRARTWGNGGSNLREAIFTAAVRNAADTADAVVLDIGKAHLLPGVYAPVPIVAHFDFGAALPEGRAVRFRLASSTGETVQVYDYSATILTTKG